VIERRRESERATGQSAAIAQAGASAPARARSPD
jgi:hypothetical protein